MPTPRPRRGPAGGEVVQLLAIMDAAYDRKSWHGPNLRGSIRGVTMTQSVWRPAKGRHNIWELVVHAAYWKYIGVRRLTGSKRGSFPLTGSNWWVRPQTAPPSSSAWRADLALLERTHRELRDAVSRLTSADLAQTPPGSRVSNVALLSGVAAHDLYHAGQIQLLKRLAPR
jgi:hypothetical protein